MKNVFIRVLKKLTHIELKLKSFDNNFALSNFYGSIRIKMNKGVKITKLLIIHSLPLLTSKHVWTRCIITVPEYKTLTFIFDPIPTNDTIIMAASKIPMKYTAKLHSVSKLPTNSTFTQVADAGSQQQRRQQVATSSLMPFNSF